MPRNAGIIIENLNGTSWVFFGLPSSSTSVASARHAADAAAEHDDMRHFFLPLASQPVFSLSVYCIKRGQLTRALIHIN
jgi:hypothetical protein